MKAYTPKKMLTRETAKALAAWDEKHENEIDAIILWELHTSLGFGRTRLKRFYKGFTKAYEDLRSRYECGEDGAIWVCQQKLKEIGVDINEWKKETQNR